MRVHWLQHAAHEDSGCIEPWLRGRGHAVSHTPLHEGAALPAVDAFDWLIVMGGPMNIYEHDRHPWLVPEKALIRAAIERDKRVLGVCLGAQLVADVLGGPVTRNAHDEIGWFPVTLTPAGRAAPLLADFPATFAAFHWHGDTYALPPGAAQLAASAACAQQAFAWGARVVGLQFHLEVTADGARTWFAHDAPAPARWVQPAAEILREPSRFAQDNRLMTALLARLESA